MNLSRAIIENISDPIFVLDSDCAIIELNPAAGSLLHLSRGKSALRALARTSPHLSRILAQLPNTTTPRPGITIGTGETQRDFEVRISPFINTTNLPNCNIVLLRDITERKAIQHAANQQADEFSTLLGVSNAISSTLQLEEMIPIIAEQWVKALGVSGCTLSRFDRNADAVITWIGWSRYEVDFSIIPGTIYHLSDYPPTRFVLETRAPLTVHADDPDAHPAEVSLLQAAGVASLLMVPLVAGDQVIGLVELDDAHKRQFTDAEIRLCIAMADQVAVAIQNAMRFEELGKHLTERTMLHKAITAITSTLDQKDVLSHLAEQFALAANATSAYIYIYDSDNRTSTVVAEHISAAANIKERVSDLGTTYNYFHDEFEFLKTHTPEQYFADGPDITEREHLYLQQFGAQSILLIPMHMRGESIAYAEIWDTRERREFTEDQISLCLLLAQQATIAVENAQLYDEALRSLKEQTALRETMELITSSLDSDTVLSTLAEQLCLVVEATSAYLVAYDPTTKIARVEAEYFSAAANDKERIADIGEDFLEENPERLDSGQVNQYHIDDPDISKSVRENLKTFGGQSVLIIPVQIKGQTLAYVEIWDSRQKREFSAGELHLCLGVAQQAAIAMQNARLFEQAQHEISERKRIEEILRYKTLHDPLTGLPNRTLFTEHLDLAIARAKRDRDYVFAVLFLDLDRFKNVNDTLGHDVGDKVLIEAARRIQTCVRAIDTVARMGGDEFVCLLDSLESAIQAINIAHRIHDALSVPIEVDEYSQMMSASIGIASNSTVYLSHEEYLRDADIAMRRAKARGKARLEIFDKKMRDQVLLRVNIENELYQAIEAQEFRLYYQPIVRLDTQEIQGFEALLRWDHVEKGIVSPAGFLEVAEEVGLIIPINLWVLDAAYQQMLRWQKEFSQVFANGKPPWTISVNISSKLLSQPALVDELRQIVHHQQPKSVRLVLEVTESALIDDTQTAYLTMLWLRELGFEVHLDDFGTGYSSLSHLSNFSIDAIKIDRSFVTKMVNSKADARLVRTIILMAHELGISVIAEGIETEAQLASLKEWDCDSGQGYLFSKPQDIEGINSYISNSLNKSTKLLK